MHDEHWSQGEKAIARRAFDAALSREYSVLIKEVRRRANNIAGPSDIWELHDFLSISRKTFDEKYDYRYSVLVFIFARLIREGWLTEADLEGLGEDKLTRIRLVLEI